VIEIGQAIALQGVQPSLCIPPNRHYTGIAQHPQVLRHGRPRNLPG
jgi:hypothetical protein